MFNKLKNMFFGHKKRKPQPLTGDEKAYANLNRIRIRARLYLQNMEATINDSLPNCQELIMEALEIILNNSFEAAKSWDSSFDYDKHTYMVIYKISYELLLSGRFHIYRGVLNPYDESTHLIGVFRQCLEWMVQKGYIDEDYKIGELQMLWDEIQQVG